MGKDAEIQNTTQDWDNFKIRIVLTFNLPLLLTYLSPSLTYLKTFSYFNPRQPAGRGRTSDAIAYTMSW